MALSLSDRTDHITQAEIRVMTIECEKVGGVNLAQGVCDLGVPREVVDGTVDAIERGYNSYTRYDGLPELRQAIAGKLRRFNGIEGDPETEISVSAGSTGSLYCACLALLNPGDEVILFEPFYGYHVNTLLAVNAVPRGVTMHPPDWQFDPGDLERAVPRRYAALPEGHDLPNTRRICREVLSLPMSAETSHADVDSVVDAVRRFFETR